MKQIYMEWQVRIPKEIFHDFRVLILKINLE